MDFILQFYILDERKEAPMCQARTDHDPFPPENVEKAENYTGS